MLCIHNNIILLNLPSIPYLSLTVVEYSVAFWIKNINRNIARE